ncbi:MAG: ABC transporter permease [Deltaproteobacteria bacterium]|nr:ABC transporter permease [Deltaproteobacteria bacterium]
MMRLIRILAQALMAVRAFKVRTFFCLVSVALGISAITVIVATTEGAFHEAYLMVERFGPDSLMVIAGSDEARAVGQRTKTITLADVEAARQAFTSAYLTAPLMAVEGTTASYKNNKYQTLIIGSTSDYSSAWSWPVIEGSDLSENDVIGLKNVGLIGQDLLRELFGTENPVGKFVMVKQVLVQIIGVLSERGMSPTGVNLDNRLIMPVSTVMRKIINETRYVTLFRIRFLDQENLGHYENEMKLFLRQRHALADDQPNDFRIISPMEIIKFLVALTGSLIVFLGLAGVICLIGAGFVLANLFLLSVKERTREIGIRRSIGAKKGDILFQFLAEAVMITTAGGVVGFLLGLVSSKLLTMVAEFPIYFSWKSAVVGLLLSWAIGIGFGLQPASRAANLEPIKAVRE